MNYVYRYKIADCVIRMELPSNIQVENKFHMFLTDKEADVTIQFVEVDKLPVITEENLVKEADVFFSEHCQKDTYLRMFFKTGQKVTYALLRQVKENVWECQYLSSHRHLFQSIGDCFSHIALERILMENWAMILHASLIRVNETGILFTGVSGIGKSTQAALWETYEQAEILNGDRSILRKRDGRWYAYGSPYAGSSKIYKNASVPVKAIVALEQGQEDTCVRLNSKDAFRVLYAGITWNNWNREYVETGLELLQDMVMSIPVYFLTCRPTQSAVETLKRELFQTDRD